MTSIITDRKFLIKSPNEILQDKIEEVFLEIQKSNMSKLDANGNPIFREDGKVLKSERYFKPNIKQFF